MQENKYSLFSAFITLYKKEVKRFLKVWSQTIFGPLITMALFLLVFVVSVGRELSGTSYTYTQFLVPGLIMMAIIQNSFANASSSLIISKLNGSIIDILMIPLPSKYIILAYSLAGITRGILIMIVSITFIFIISLFDNSMSLSFDNIFWIAYFAFISSMILSNLGILAGIIAKKFDGIAQFTNLVIMPFSFLSGSFYSISRLPEFFQNISQYNPFFHMINGFRYGFIGATDANILFGAIFLFIINAISYLIISIMWQKGYKLKS